MIKQLSVFLENRGGRLEKVVKVLKDNQINILSFSLADTSEYGVLRLIVSDTEMAKKTLHDKGFSALITDVLAIKLPQEVGSLHNMLAVLSGKEIGVEYMYVLTNGDERGIVVKVTNVDEARNALREQYFELFETNSSL